MMFFFIIGLGKTTVDRLGSAGTRVCPNCSNRAEWSLLRIREWLTLFFVPVFPYKTRDVAQCPVCKYQSDR
jgi:RNA polymerase subunit RPABC4/transcription elongation factor Spt4